MNRTGHLGFSVDRVDAGAVVDIPEADVSVGRPAPAHQ